MFNQDGFKLTEPEFNEAYDVFSDDMFVAELPVTEDVKAKVDEIYHMVLMDFEHYKNDFHSYPILLIATHSVPWMLLKIHMELGADIEWFSIPFEIRDKVGVRALTTLHNFSKNPEVLEIVEELLDMARK